MGMRTRIVKMYGFPKSLVRYSCHMTMKSGCANYAAPTISYGSSLPGRFF